MDQKVLSGFEEEKDKKRERLREYRVKKGDGGRIARF